MVRPSSTAALRMTLPLSVTAVPPLRDTADRLSAGARAISRSRTERVKTPAPRPMEKALARRETPVAARVCAAILMAALLGAPVASAADRSLEPLSDWLSGIGTAAQAQVEGDLSTAERASRRALRARPRGAAGARAQAALGIALLARGEPGEAAEMLETALGAPVPARAHLAFARGDALLAIGDAPRAARLFGQAAAGASGLSFRAAARLREAQALLAAGLAEEAAAGLEALLRTPLDPASAAVARLALARALRAAGEAERAAAILRAVWVELPERPEGEAAAEALARWRAAGGPIPPESGAEHVARAERLLAGGWPEEALFALAAADRADDPPAHPERAPLLRAMALLALGRHADAERAALPLVNATADDVQRGARLVLARVAARTGRVDEASRLYAEIATRRARIPGLPEWRQRDIGDEAAFLAAWLFYDADQFSRAIPALEAFARANPRSRRAEDALWFAAWSRYRLGRAADADRAFAALSRGPLGDAALYWRARLAKTPARQKALYRASLAMNGSGWYALLARAQLAALGEHVPRPRSPPPRPLPEIQEGFAAARLSIAVELLGLGLRPQALDELRDLSRSGKIRPAAALVAQLAAFAGDPDVPFRMARDHLFPSRRVLRWGYPEPHRDAVERAARGFGVEPALLLGVMRRESSFREAARSHAGAEGLLQLLPSTAERVTAVLGVPGGFRGRLLEPEPNIAVGAHYLGLLLSRFGDPVVAVAAYNAGPRAAAEWAVARQGMPLDAWVESIPYRETRQYVKIVIPEWDTYRALAGEEPPPIDPARPVAAPAAGVAF
jgi:soluble lytic murein transglycosylase